MNPDIEYEADSGSEVEAGNIRGGANAVTVASILAEAILAADLMLTANSKILDIVFASIADAYLQVSTFVAATLIII